MNIFLILLYIFLGVPILNIISGFWLFRTKPEEQKNDDRFPVIILLFGIFLLPFYKVIKKERLIDFLENLLEQKQRDLFENFYLYDLTTISSSEKEILKLKRRIKLEKLK
jgi:hypothetical protein